MQGMPLKVATLRLLVNEKGDHYKWQANLIGGLRDEAEMLDVEIDLTKYETDLLNDLVVSEILDRVTVKR